MNYIEFTSSRKRSSMIIKDEEKKKIIMYCKGADSAIKERLKDEEKKGENLKKCLKIMDELSEEGLRTLLFAKKEISENDYNSFSEKYNKAKS